MDTIELIKDRLDEIGFKDLPGSILYSGNETIRKGKFYFLGANPGGHSDQKFGMYPDTVENQLLRKNTSSDFNEYFDARWQIRGRTPSAPGKALLQRRIKFFFEQINVDLRQVLSTNLVFVRSPTQEEFNLDWNESAEKCWTVHEILLSVVCPQIIIAYGSEASEFIKKKMIISRNEYFEVASLNETKYFSSTEGELKINNNMMKIKLISMPHLSRYKINAKGLDYGDAYDTRPALEWIAKEILSDEVLS
jgi:hypothetical protein